MLDPGGPLRKDSFRARAHERRGPGRIAHAPEVIEARPGQKGQGQGHGQRRVPEDRAPHRGAKAPAWVLRDEGQADGALALVEGCGLDHIRLDEEAVLQHGGERPGGRDPASGRGAPPGRRSGRGPCARPPPCPAAGERGPGRRRAGWPDGPLRRRRARPDRARRASRRGRGHRRAESVGAPRAPGARRGTCGRRDRRGSPGASRGAGPGDEAAAGTRPRSASPIVA